MSNPTFGTGPITFKAVAKVDRYHLVQLTEDGVKHAEAGKSVFGAVTENAAPAGERPENDLTLGLPDHVAVHTDGVVPLVVTGAVAVGDAVEATADGKAKKVASGTPVGVVVRGKRGDTAQVKLLTPVVE